jgi:hypothetical protein
MMAMRLARPTWLIDISRLAELQRVIAPARASAGEAGYLGAPSAIACAINDALAPLGASIAELPMTPLRIWKRMQPVRAGN